MSTDAAAPAPRALVFVNPVAPHHDAAALRHALDTAFEGAYRIVETTSEGNASGSIADEIVRASEQGCDLVVAAGGDGTVSLLADSLASQPAQRRMRLAIVPLGTANVLARELGIPIDVERAVAVAAERRGEASLDTIRYGEQHFLTQVGVGIDSRMIRDTDRESQIAHGRWAYFASFFRSLTRHRSHRFVVDVDGRRMTLRALQIAVANAGTLGTPPFRWGPDIDPTDGVLNLCVYDVRSVADHVHLAWRLLTGRAGKDDRARFFPVRREVTIASRRPLPVQGDGEEIARTPVTLNVAPGTLRVVTPAPPEPVAEGGGATSSVAVPAAKQSNALTRIGAIDSALFLYINVLPRWRPLDWLMVRASRLMDLGEGWVILVLVVGVLGSTRDARMPLVVIAALWLAMLTVNFPIKALFRRARPFVTHVDTLVIGRRPVDWSFPSGHTAAAFAGAVLVSARIPGSGPWCYAYAVIVALSRVYLGVHYPSDVVIGAVIGTALALVYGAGLEALVPR